jgi:hypothetical protein
MAQTTNTVAGFSDTATFGLTTGVRELMGTNDMVDPLSWGYQAGVGVGIGFHALTGNPWGMAYGGATLATNYGRWSTANPGHALSADSMFGQDAGRVITLLGSTAQAYAGVRGGISQIGQIAAARPMAAVGVIAGQLTVGVASLPTLATHVSDTYSNWSKMDWLDKAQATVPVVAGLPMRSITTRVATVAKQSAFHAVNTPLSIAVHGGLARISAKAHDKTSAFLNRLGFKVCFAAGTPLRTPHGSMLIENLCVGDLVMSRDEHDPRGEVVAQRVEQVFVRQGLVWHLHLGGQVLRTTAEHPFFVDGKGWTATHDLAIGERILCEDGTTVAVDDLLDTGEWETVYNLQVAEHHTYFVGCDEWGFSVWAHNAQYGDDILKAGVKLDRGVQELAQELTKRGVKSKIAEIKVMKSQHEPITDIDLVTDIGLSTVILVISPILCEIYNPQDGRLGPP